MHRSKLKDLLKHYKPSNAQEQADKKQIDTFVEENEACFDRALEKGHITASAWLINHDNTKALLTHHKKLNKWIQLGGHCDDSFDPLETALKEAQEESGIALIQPVMTNIFDLAVFYLQEKGNMLYHYDIRFLLQAVEDVPFIVSHESHDLKWISKDIAHLPNPDEALLRMFTKWVNDIHPTLSAQPVRTQQGQL